jgi:glycosyltransferase involved in cell wall biosynthesis
MQEVVRQLSERMTLAGHEVTVATGQHPLRIGNEFNGVRIAAFAISGNIVTGMTGELARYREFVLSDYFDVVVNFAAQQWATDALLPYLEQIPAARVFVPTGFSALHDRRYHDYFASMPGWLHQYDMNIFPSEDYRDINYARQHGVDKLTVIPNGADEREFMGRSDNDIRQRLGISPSDLLILLVGSHTGLKGHAEAIKLVRRARVGHVTLLIVAHKEGGGCEQDCMASEQRACINPFWRFASKRLLVRSLSRSETVAACQQADLMLFPSQIECSPVVLFEAMASRTPFLSTDVGNAAEIVRWSGGGELMPTSFDEHGYSKVNIPDASKALEQLCRDGQKRQRLADEGHKAWRKRFTWELIASQYMNVYHELSRSR